MEDEEKERAEFEETYHSKWRNGKPKIMADGEYNSLAFQCAWEGWQASAARYTTQIAELEAEAVRADLKANGALLLAVSAVYFDDSSDYESALIEIVTCIGGLEMAEELKNDPSAVYHKAMRIAEADEAMKGGA